LEGLEISEVMFSYVLIKNDIFRFDSNYFQKKFLLEETVIRDKQYITLKNIEADVRSFGAYSLNNEVHYSDKGIPFIRGVNMKKGRVSFSDMIFIDELANSLLWKSEVKPEMILLSMSGTIGDVAIASKNWIYPINSNQDIAKIDTQGKISAYFLYAFLMSKFGQNYIKREARGSVQQHVFLSQIEQFEIPIFSENFEKSIQNVIEQSNDLLSSSESCYAQAETLLLDTLGIADFSPGTEAINVKSFRDSFAATGRLDAEYYQPKYEKIEKACFENAAYIKRIKNIQLHNGRGLQPGYVQDGKLNVINSRHILEQELDYKNFEKTSLESWNYQAKARVFRNDILIYTTGANIGRTQVYLSDERALASNHVNILRIKDENHIYVAFFLNSKIGRLQTEQLSAGSAQQELYPKYIENFYVPFVNPSIQTKIADLVQQSFTLKAESERLLDIAKRAVEIAIEQDENAGMTYIKSQHE
jgi:restriction endonuclease S subunit